MLLGFKRRFSQFVEEGSKPHTIRGKRKIRPQAGEMCHCYVDPRQKTMRLLGRFKCVRVQEIVFRNLNESNYAPDRIGVFIEGEMLSPDEREQFFYRDGFREPGRSSTEQAFDFWAGQVLPFVGDLIHWEFPG